MKTIALLPQNSKRDVKKGQKPKVILTCKAEFYQSCTEERTWISVTLFAPSVVVILRKKECFPQGNSNCRVRVTHVPPPTKLVPPGHW